MVFTLAEASDNLRRVWRVSEERFKEDERIMITIILPKWLSIVLITSWTIFSLGMAVMLLLLIWIALFEYPSPFNRRAIGKGNV